LSVVRDHALVFVLDDNVRAGPVDEEPQPGEAFREADPERAARWSQRPPRFVCYWFRKLA
jgi:hypothetical protein